MKIIKAHAVVLVSSLLVACTSESSENNETETTTEQETTVDASTNESGIVVQPSDVNVNLKVDLKRINLPELELSVGLPSGWSANLGPGFGDMAYYEILNDKEVMLLIYSKAAVSDFNEGRFPDNPEIIADQYDLESTNFFVLDNRTNAVNKKIVGIVYQYSDDESDLRFEYYVQLSGDNYVNITEEMLTQNVDVCLAIINSIQPMN